MDEKTFVTQVDNGIECKDIFKILEELRDNEKDKEYGDRSNKSKIFNRFSGTYFSPTFIKSFGECPARAFINNCIPRTYNKMANFGSATHKVFERIVKEKCFDDQAKCFDIAKEEENNFKLEPDTAKTLEEKYLPNFLASEDYCHNGEKFPWDRVEMFPEQFYKSDLSVFDIPLGPCFTLMDRLDIRDEGIFIIDYKTGPAPRNSQYLAEFVANYTNQMIVYSWQIEKQYGMPVKGVYAYLPDNNKFVEFPVHSLKLQSILVEEIVKYYEDIKNQRENFFFEERTNKYCKYCNIKEVCNAYKKTNNSVRMPIDLSLLN